MKNLSMIVSGKDIDYCIDIATKLGWLRFCHFVQNFRAILLCLKQFKYMLQNKSKLGGILTQWLLQRAKIAEQGCFPEIPNISHIDQDKADIFLKSPSAQSGQSMGLACPGRTKNNMTQGVLGSFRVLQALSFSNKDIPSLSVQFRDVAFRPLPNTFVAHDPVKVDCFDKFEFYAHFF